MSSDFEKNNKKIMGETNENFYSLILTNDLIPEITMRALAINVMKLLLMHPDFIVFKVFKSCLISSYDLSFKSKSPFFAA